MSALHYLINVSVTKKKKKNQVGSYVCIFENKKRDDVWIKVERVKKDSDEADNTH